MFTKADIEQYFNAEKAESWLFMAIGIAGIIAAAIFFFSLKTSFYKGAAIPLLAVGLLLGVVGYTVYKRSDDDRKRNAYAYDLNPSELRTKEIPRMETVMKNFVMYRYVEMGLALLGIGLFVYFGKNIDQTFWKGFGLTLTVMSLLALGADFFAERRGHVYLNGLKEYTAKKR
jgi:hypothetical protein